MKTTYVLFIAVGFLLGAAVYELRDAAREGKLAGAVFAVCLGALLGWLLTLI